MGVICGIPVFVISISGASLIFEKEIKEHFTRTDLYQEILNPNNKPIAEPSLRFGKVLQAMPEGGTKLYSKTSPTKNTPILTWFYYPGDEEKGIEKSYVQILQNPYNGDLISHKLWEDDFWEWARF